MSQLAIRGWQHWAYRCSGMTVSNMESSLTSTTYDFIQRPHEKTTNANLLQGSLLATMLMSLQVQGKLPQVGKLKYEATGHLSSYHTFCVSCRPGFCSRAFRAVFHELYVLQANIPWFLVSFGGFFDDQKVKANRMAMQVFGDSRPLASPSLHIIGGKDLMKKVTVLATIEVTSL